MPAIIAIAQILVTMAPSFWAAPLGHNPAVNHLILISADFSVTATELNRNSAKQCRINANLGPNLWVPSIKI